MDKDNMKDPKLDAAAATRMLEDIFDQANVEHNTVPIEALSAYSGYKKERFKPRKTLLAIAIVLVALLPVLFVSPDYSVSKGTSGDGNGTEYEIDVSSVLPVGYVTASMNGRKLPVYEVDSHTYMVEPEENGELEVEVSLFNDQKESQTVEVTGIDGDGPAVTGSRMKGADLVIYVSDDGSGVDYDAAYALNESGNTVEPKAVSEKKGTITFRRPQKGWEIFIPDRSGNCTHLKLAAKR